MEWQPIDALKKPTEFGPIELLLAHNEKRWVRMGRYYPQVGKWYYSGTNERSQWAQIEGDEPTHWMPLPPAPST